MEQNNREWKHDEDSSVYSVEHGVRVFAVCRSDRAAVHICKFRITFEGSSSLESSIAWANQVLDQFESVPVESLDKYEIEGLTKSVDSSEALLTVHRNKVAEAEAVLRQSKIDELQNSALHRMLKSMLYSRLGLTQEYQAPAAQPRQSTSATVLEEGATVTLRATPLA